MPDLMNHSKYGNLLTAQLLSQPRRWSDPVWTYCINTVIRNNIYRIANKDAVTSLIYNFILHRIAHSAFDNKSPDSTSHLISFEINNTPSGILLRQCSSNSIASGQSTSLATPDALEISDQLTALLEITQAHIHRSILEIPLRSSSQLKRVGLSNLSGRVISTNSARRAAISNRLEDLGMKITSEEKNVNCFFVDAGQQITSPQQIDKWSKSGIVFLFNDSGPWGDANSRAPAISDKA